MIRESNTFAAPVTSTRGPKRTARRNRPLDDFKSLARDLARSLGFRSSSLILAEMFLGKTTDSTSGSPLYTDARYEVKRHRPKWSLGTNDLLTLEVDQYPYTSQQIVTATNVSEMVSASHSLPVDTPVYVFGLIIPKEPQAIQYFFISGGIAGFFPVKVQKTGGSDGSVSAANSYVYTARTIEWNGTGGGSVLGTNLTPTQPRQKGLTTAQTGSVGIGTGYYDLGTFKLKEAGEIPTTAACS